MSKTKFGLALLLVAVLAAGIYNAYRPLPSGLNFGGPVRSVSDVRFLTDLTYTQRDGERQSEQMIFDEVFNLVEGAQRFILVDMFLFNDFQGRLAETHRSLSSELTGRLIQQQQRFPAMQILVITDPLNTLYGGLRSVHLEQLARAGISVTVTDLSKLRDSNPLYSSVWRLFIQPWGNSPGKLLPSPFSNDRVSLRSYLHLLNFKANHRKVVIADRNDTLTALVTSANPHDGSSAHGNVALRFSGPPVADLLSSERAVLRFSGGPEPLVDLADFANEPSAENNGLGLQVLTERAVERAMLDAIDTAQADDRLDLAAFYLSDRGIIKSLLRAHERGVRLRLLLDPNKDAFGRVKSGIPNRPVAHELTQAGIPVRWCDTRGEQCHAKLLMIQHSDGSAKLLLGSSNFTRRNLRNLNLETSVLLSGAATAQPLTEAAEWFEHRWDNQFDRQFSVEYDAYADSRLWPRLKYRIMEATGMSTF